MVVRGAAHDAGAGWLAAETEGGEGGCEHVDPEDLQRAEGEDGEAAVVLEAEADDQEHHFADVGGQEVQDELVDVVGHAAAFFDGGDYAGEVVVREDDVCGALCDVGSGEAHGYADVCGLEGGRVVDAVARHCGEGVAAVEGGDHAGFGVGGAACDDEGQHGQGVDLDVCHGVEFGGSLY